MLKIRNTNQPEPADHGEGEGDGGDDGREEEARAHPVRLTHARNWILNCLLVMTQTKTKPPFFMHY